MSHRHTEKSAKDAALFWVLRLDEGELEGGAISEAEREQFQAWLLASPENEHEFRLARLTLATVQELPKEAYSRAASSASALPNQSLRRWASISVAVSLLVALLGWFVAESGGGWFGEHSAIEQTPAGATQVVHFRDGSLAYLNTRSKVRWMGDRRVELITGEVLFDVAHDEAKPFTVALEGSEIRVLGTRFNVYRKPSDDIVITVLEGEVEVRGLDRNGGQPKWVRRLYANQQLSYRALGLTGEPHDVDSLRAVQWRESVLQVDGEPLQTVLEELARYTDKRIIIRDPRIARFRIGGRFETRDVSLVLKALERISPIEVHESESAYVLDYREPEAERDGVR